LAALGELDAEQARPEATRTVGVISRELDQPKWCVHPADDNGASADGPAPRRRSGYRRAAVGQIGLSRTALRGLGATFRSPSRVVGRW
jgi:hypothetical protein